MELTNFTGEFHTDSIGKSAYPNRLPNRGAIA
jgi:hypothetical protein